MNKPGVTRVLLARRLRILRAARGWSQEVLAELAGLTRGYVSAVERVEYNVSLDNIEKIARAFGMTGEEFVGAGIGWDSALKLRIVVLCRSNSLRADVSSRNERRASCEASQYERSRV